MTMILTKKKLKKMKENMFVDIPKSIEQEFSKTFGTYDEDDEGHIFQYTEQDIYEQIRKRLQQYKEYSNIPADFS